MHSSCIVVRLDWAAGLPALLIRSFGTPEGQEGLCLAARNFRATVVDKTLDIIVTLRGLPHLVGQPYRRPSLGVKTGGSCCGKPQIVPTSPSSRLYTIIRICYTGPISHQCNAHPAFPPQTDRSIHKDVRILYILAGVQLYMSPFRGRACTTSSL